MTSIPLSVYFVRNLYKRAFSVIGLMSASYASPSTRFVSSATLGPEMLGHTAKDEKTLKSICQFFILSKSRNTFVTHPCT